MLPPLGHLLSQLRSALSLSHLATTPKPSPGVWAGEGRDHWAGEGDDLPRRGGSLSDHPSGAPGPGVRMSAASSHLPHGSGAGAHAPSPPGDQKSHLVSLGHSLAGKQPDSPPKQGPSWLKESGWEHRFLNLDSLFRPTEFESPGR